MPSINFELPIAFAPNDLGHVYRSRASKYEWAPDVYLAFPWRFNLDKDTRETQLMVSRDAIHWHSFRDNFYYGSGWEIDGKKITEVMSIYGQVRRGDDLWQYYMVSDGTHYGKTTTKWIVRVVQRLDGFVSMDAKGGDGMATTHPLVFEGERLELNVAAKGRVRVGIEDANGETIAGFGVEDCDPIRVDRVRHVATWGGRSDVSALAGRAVRLRFALEDAKVYALEFRRP